MARGDMFFFEEALDDAFFTGWAASDDIRVAILDNTTTPTADFANPALGSFTQVGTGGTYATTSLGAWGTLSVESGGTLTFDSATDPSWAADGSNDTDAYWALIYNDDQSGDPAFMYLDLGGPVDMTAGALTITWNGSGLFTIS